MFRQCLHYRSNARGEDYMLMLVVFGFAGDWVAGAKAIWLAPWFWAGVSKLNHHFPSVVGGDDMQRPAHAERALPPLDDGAPSKRPVAFEPSPKCA